jgi:adenylosuccinate synthase
MDYGRMGVELACGPTFPEQILPVSQRKSAVILGAQWGDEGKGKIVDVLSEKFSVVARYAGGHNAGHTVIIAGKKFVLQLIPCGVLRPECKGVIGNGVVLDPMAFLSEVKKLKDAGLKIGWAAFCVQPGAGDSAIPPDD